MLKIYWLLSTHGEIDFKVVTNKSNNEFEY